MKKHGIISNLVETQKASSELVVTSVLLAVGVNLLSSGLAELFEIPYRAWVLVLVGAIIGLGVVVYNLRSKLCTANNSVKIDGFVVYNEKELKLVAVPEYQISADMINYLRSACAENKAIEKVWKSGTINRFLAARNRNDNSGDPVETYSGELFIELLEYCVIHKLSLHLSSFYADRSEQSKVKKLHRSDIPDVLLKNRFLKLFSEDMINREAFACSERPVESNEANTVVAAYNETGALYSRFDLILPKDSKVIRKKKNELLIDTPILSMSIEIIHDGFSTILKPDFHKYYLGITNDILDYRNYAFAIKVTVSFKIKSLFSGDKENYYAWVDGFLDTLTSYVSKERFFETINWDATHALLHSFSNMNPHSTKSQDSTMSQTTYTIIEQNDD